MKNMLVAMAVIALAVTATAGGAAPQGHPALQPKIAPDSVFPLYDAQSLATNGYPDHQHEFFWPGWTPPQDSTGTPYGFGTFCHGLQSLDREGLQVDPGHLVFSLFDLRFDKTAQPCYVAPFLGFCEMARHDAGSLLQLEPTTTLKMFNPDDMATYTAMSGFGSWRMYRRDGGKVVLEPVGILAQRSLIAHAARDLVLRWILDDNGGADLPAWFREGLAAWFAELGVHLNNYMAPLRPAGSPLLGPDEIDIALDSPPLDDPEADRGRFRQARYSAFLMVWEMVEHHGGLEPMRDFLHAVRDGRDADAAASQYYGANLDGLAEKLDPRLRPEPLGDNVAPRNPTRPPQ